MSFAMSEGNVFIKQMVLLQWTREKPVVQPSKEVTAIEGSHGYGRNVQMQIRTVLANKSLFE